MPSLNFTQFVGKVQSGEKRCTIRARRKRPIRVGESLHLYTGMRTKQCRKLMQVPCRAVTPITIDWAWIHVGIGELSEVERFELARRDGFLSPSHLYVFFRKTHGLPFQGDLIEW